MKYKTVFIDTGAFYALIDRDDPYHVVAYKEWSQILTHSTQLIITNYIISETYTLLRYRLGGKIACEFLDAIEESTKIGRIKVVIAALEIEKQARQLLQHFFDYDLSYTDAISLATIKQIQIPVVFSFDGHFSIAEAAVIP